MSLPDPEFPPLLTGHPVKAPEKPFAEAVKGALNNRHFGAGDVLWGKSTDMVHWAVVLEPEVALATAQQMMPLAMAAIGDCLGVLTPPQVAVTFRWPGTILINGAEAGRISAAVPKEAGKNDIPDWLVIGLDLGLKRPANAPEPGETPDQTVLADEGGDALDRTRVIESFSRHFLTWLHNWQDDGFKSVADSWLFRAEGRGEEISLAFQGEEHEGIFLGLDSNGGLLLKKEGEAELLELLSCFERH